MTKVLLDTVFFKCIAEALAVSNKDDDVDVDNSGTSPSNAASGLGQGLPGSVSGSGGLDFVRDSLVAFERAYREAYADVSGIARLTELAGAALRTGRAHLYYVGVGISGMVGMIDASEMVDTCVSLPLPLRVCHEVLRTWTCCLSAVGCSVRSVVDDKHTRLLWGCLWRWQVRDCEIEPFADISLPANFSTSVDCTPCSSDMAHVLTRFEASSRLDGQRATTTKQTCRHWASCFASHGSTLSAT